MSNLKKLSKLDRFLTLRDGIYTYVRRVPTDMEECDSRSPNVRISLKTSDLAEARIKRDVYEKADDQFWLAKRKGGGDNKAARDMYEAAVARATAIGIEYRDANQFAAMRVEDVIQQLAKADSLPVTDPSVSVLAGLIKAPLVIFSEAAKIYFDEITPHQILFKSPKQRIHWRNVKQRAVKSFIEIVADKAMIDITRTDANKFYKAWLDCVAPASGKPTHSASSGNRHVGNVRVIYSSYFTHIGERDRPNPFDGLGFTDKKDRHRPPFSVDWIIKNILKKEALAGLNPEARGIVLALIETGARPSEICNIVPEHIMLDDDVPHILIKPRNNSDDPREIKTKSSIRTIPLLGVALSAFKANPKGFPRYKDKEDSLSGALNKYFKDNKLFESPSHKIYSFRHSFEDRMKEANIDDELRRILMGHTVDRPKYGTGGALAWRASELLKITLPFDVSIV